MSSSGHRIHRYGVRRSSLSHTHVFLLGWCFYIGVPILAGALGWLDRIPGAAPFADYFGNQSPWWSALLAFCAALPVVFMAGSRLSRAISLPRIQEARTRGISKVLLVAYLALLVAFTWNARDSLFGGYLQGVDSNVVGPVATLEILILFQLITCIAACERTLARCFGSMLLVCSAVLLGMGGRLYVVTALVALYFNWLKWAASGPGARWLSLALAAAAIVGLVILGMYRVGEPDLDQFTFYFLAEPMYTGISGLSLVLNGNWGLFDTPKDFFSGFVNLVPAIVWPGKSDYLTSLVDTSLDLESPFGGLSIIASTIANFGFVGGLAFIAFVGAILGWSSRNSRGPVGRALYCVLVSLLPFMFFRDPFAVQVKVVLTTFIIVAAHLLVGGSVPARRRNARVQLAPR